MSRGFLAPIAIVIGLGFATLALAANPTHIDRQITITVDRSKGVFSGRVLSSRPGICADGARVYVLQKRRGPDKRLAGAFASVKDARWQVTLGGQQGTRIYAKVPRLVTRRSTGTTICRAAVSPVVAA